MFIAMPPMIRIFVPGWGRMFLLLHFSYNHAVPPASEQNCSMDKSNIQQTIFNVVLTLPGRSDAERPPVFALNLTAPVRPVSIKTTNKQQYKLFKTINRRQQ